MRLFFHQSGPMLRYRDGTFEASDLNPEVSMRWAMSRPEMLVLAWRCLVAGVRGNTEVPAGAWRLKTRQAVMRIRCWLRYYTAKRRRSVAFAMTWTAFAATAASLGPANTSRASRSSELKQIR